MSPKPAGTSGPKPPRNAKLAMDRKEFARQQTASQQPRGLSPAPGGSVAQPGKLRANLAKNDAKIDRTVKKINAQAKARLSGQPKTTKQAFGTAASKGMAKTAFSAASRSAAKGTAKAAFSSATKGGGKGGKSR